MTPEDTPSPYRGIHPFRFVDRDYYFGREELIEELTAKVLLYRLVVLFGESGVGKSSLINAGLIGALRKKSFQPERLRVRPFEGQPISVERVASGGGSNGQYLPSIFPPISDENGQSAVVFCSLDHFKKRIEANLQAKHIVLIFDQFEELFTLFSQRNSSAAAQTDALQQRLLETIVNLINNPLLKVKIVIAIREDYLAKLDVLAENYPQVFDNRVLLGQLGKKDAARAILCPFRTQNLFKSRLTTTLAMRIIRELSNNRNDGSIHPTQLQIVCRRLWENFAKEVPVIGTPQFREMGETKGIIEGFLAAELAQIDKIDKSLKVSVLGVLSNLITESNTKDVVSKKKLEKLMSRSTTSDLLGKVLDLLESRRLINSVAERGTTFYELSSEFLIGPIQKEREDYLLLSERQRERALVKRRVKVGSLIALLILSVLTFVAYEINQRKQARVRAFQEAEEARKLLLQESKDASQIRTLLNNLSDLASVEAERREAARANIAQLAEQNQIPTALLPLIEDVVRRKDPDAADNYLNTLNQVISKTPHPVDSPNTYAISVQVQIFSDEEHRAQARQIQKALEREGIVVPGIQTAVQGPRRHELRYFIIADEASANETANKIKQLGLTGIRALYVPGYQNSTFVKTKQFELWFPALASATPTSEPQLSPTPSVAESGWFVFVNLEVPSSIRRLMVVNLLIPIAARDGVGLKSSASGVKLGPYRNRYSAELARILVAEALSTYPVRLREPPSVSFQ